MLRLTIFIATLLLLNISLNGQRTTENEPGIIELKNGSVTGVVLDGGSLFGSPTIGPTPGEIELKDLNGVSRITMKGGQSQITNVPELNLRGTVGIPNSRTFVSFTNDLLGDGWNLGMAATDFGSYFEFKYRSNAGGSAVATITSGGMFTSSDRRLKKDIVTIDAALPSLLKVNATQYSRKNTPSINEFGFIAQEIEKIYPEMVIESPNEDGGTQYMMNYTQMIPLLTKGLQEQQAIIEKQNELIEALSERVSFLEKEN